MALHLKHLHNFMFIKYAILILFSLLFFFNPLFGQEWNKEFETSDGFTLTSTEGWIEIPKDILDQYVKSISDQTNTEKQHWHLAYQLSSSETWFQYPYILIKVAQNGRIPESELTNFKAVKLGFNQGIQEIEKKVAGLVSDLNFGETYFDREAHILFTIIKANVQSFGDIIGLTALKLTEKGYIQISGYSLSSEADKYISVFKNIAHQIKLEEHLVYNPRQTDSTPFKKKINWGEVGEKILIATIIDFIIPALGLLFKKLKKS